MNAIATIGRPSTFNDAIAERLVSHVAEGVSLKDACIAEGIGRTAVADWLLKHETFAKAYAQARSVLLDTYSDDVIGIGDALGQDASAAQVQLAKLKTDNRRWLLSKLRADVYGDKLDVTSKGEALAAPSHQVDARVQSIVMQAAMRMQGQLTDDAASLLE